MTTQNAGEYEYKDWTLTRIHLQYEKDEIGEDLIFKKADPVVGGREFHDENGKLETGVRVSEYGQNAFQARYIIRHAWTGAVACADPRYGDWGGNPEGGGPTTVTAQSPNSTGGAVFADGSKADKVEELLLQDIPELDIIATGKARAAGGGCSATQTNSVSIGVLLFLGFILVGRRRKK